LNADEIKSARKFFAEFCPTAGMTATEIWNAGGWIASILRELGVIHRIGTSRWNEPLYVLTEGAK